MTERLSALWSEAERVLAPGSPEAPYAWLLGAALLALFFVLVVRGRTRRRTDVDRLFLMSAAATRRAREISEIETFTRRVGAATEDLRARARKLRAVYYQRAKIYIDHSNFIRTWTQEVHGRDRPLQHDVDWGRLPQVLLEEVGDWLTQQRRASPSLVYRGTNVYGTLFDESYYKLLENLLRMEETAPDRLPLPIRLRKETIDRWREENEAHKDELTRVITREPGYLIVPVVRRTPREDQLLSANFTAGGIPIAPEKKLDTQIATDLIGDAAFDVYDIALLLSEDSDFIPAVEFVQTMRNKPVIQVGFGPRQNDLRLKCRHRIDLAKGQLYRRLQRTGSA
ncbi:MAG TPA: NYN domain-containing protein [Hyphomicrobiaceae bacterium]|nr:NYN domain-containing protein [Hyphomicrobiaceae bacterium]